jgi:hypothetical protein
MAMDEAAAKKYYGRFWNLQLEQYEYWRQGFIKDDIYANWMGMRRHAFQNDEDVFPRDICTFTRAWDHAKESLKLHLYFDREFEDFIEVIKDSKGPIKDILQSHKQIVAPLR